MATVATSALRILRSDDAHSAEENTYDLPTGDKIEWALRDWFAKQRQAVLAEVPTDPLAPLPEEIKPVEDWTDPMATAMTPHLSVIWDAAGKETAGRLGFDPSKFNVTSPHLRDAIKSAALAFCRSTNKTTSQDLNSALDQLRAELETGLVDEGESIPYLRKRVSRIFDTAEKWRAQQIAATEASRGYHTAQEMAGQESGVVAGYELLLSGDACPLCRKIATEAKRVRVGQSFAVIGSNPAYKEVKHPPLHPSCQCTMIEVLAPEYGGPSHPGWAETLHQPQRGLKPSEPYKPPAGKTVPEPEPDRPKPRVTKPAAPVPKPVGHVEPTVDVTPQPTVPGEAIPARPVGHVEVPEVHHPKPTHAVGHVEPKPSGKSVTHALQIKAKGETGKAVHDALAAIAKVHGDGELPQIPVTEVKTGTALGTFRRTARNEAVDIRIHRMGNRKAWTAVHEIGHFLEKSGAGGPMTKEGFRDWSTDPVFKDWHAAVMNSGAVKQIQETAKLNSVRILGPGGKAIDVKVPKAVAKYLLTPEELWARSYSQYIARKSGDPQLLAALEHERGSSHEAQIKMLPQWYDSDFGPIEAEIDKIMARKGWRT